MAAATGTVRRFRAADVADWYQAAGAEMALGDVLEASNSGTMSVGFARYREGAANEWTVTYDEALVITRGVFTVHSEDGPRTATAGEVIFLTNGAKVTYQAEEDTELVYVTYPHWYDATRKSSLADQLDAFHPAEPPAFG
jgi:ethanolamine utilization protein EutQ